MVNDSEVEPGYSANRWKVVIRERRGRDDVGELEDAAGEVVGQRAIVLELEVQAVLQRGGAERQDDDGFRREALFGHGPRQLGQPDAGDDRLGRLRRRRHGRRPCRRLAAEGGERTEQNHEEKRAPKRGGQD